MIPSLAAHRNNDAVSLIDNGTKQETQRCCSLAAVYSDAYAPHTHQYFRALFSISGNLDAAICGLSNLVEGFRNFVCEHDDPYGKSQSDLRPTTLSLDQCMETSKPCLVAASASAADKAKDSANTTNIKNLFAEHSDDDDATPFVYRTGILMPPSLAFDKDRDSLMSSIFLFNLALAHQLRAETTSNDAERRHSLLSKALKIYELAFKMQERGGYFNSNFLFILAILNNIGVIHQILGAPLLAKRCFGKLMSVLMLLTERKFYDSTKLDMKGFFRNGSLSCGEPCTATAA